jgi:hypothetical protein
VAEALSSPLVKTDITHMSVVVSAVPFLAGCRCYARTFLTFGMDVINGEIANDDGHRGICDRPKPEIEFLIGHNSNMRPASALKFEAADPKVLAGAVKTVSVIPIPLTD